MQVIIKKSKDKQFYFVIKSSNGQTIVHSETYTRKENAIEAIELLTNTDYKIEDDT